ncbi:hypothetical protein GCM10007977_022370 [Dactylosporangium sucinum]|uniref:Uncharacterized protein n=1 Tax=Dactylosporangium sucinum TaxID=1424081 RepID=A0A917WQ56_9ACTN|nr:hypothetical protein GCM10007977_022370 [Dactylosporangium sucinum]
MVPARGARPWCPPVVPARGARPWCPPVLPACSARTAPPVPPAPLRPDRFAAPSVPRCLPARPALPVPFVDLGVVVPGHSQNARFVRHHNSKIDAPGAAAGTERPSGGGVAGEVEGGGRRGARPGRLRRAELAG